VNPVALVTGLTPITVCPGAPISPAVFTSNPTAQSFAWTNTNTAIGIGASGVGNIASWNAPTNTTISPITSSIQVTPTYNSCPGTPASFSITVNPTPSVSNTTTSQTICSGTSTTAVIWTSGVSGTSFTWTAMTNSIYLSGFNTTGIGNLPVISTLLNSSNTIDTLIYTVIPSKNGCNGPAFTYKIIVKPTPVLSRLADQIICGGTATIATNFLNASKSFLASAINSAFASSLNLPSVIQFSINATNSFSLYAIN
jgi:hypothetical protein